MVRYIREISVKNNFTSNHVLINYMKCKLEMTTLEIDLEGLEIYSQHKHG